MNGIINIYKPSGPTSHDIVDKIRKNLYPLDKGGGRVKVGHAGTLDPFAQGVLIILIGKATKLQSKFMDMDKTYVATLKLGAISDTYDKMGKIVPMCEVQPHTFPINNALKQFVGEIEQVPPIYSAIKIKGKKAYQLARKGQKPKLKPRKVKIYDIQCRKFKWPYLEIQVKCGKGTYVRSLAHDIGQKLSCGAYLEKLIRTKIGKFDVRDSIKLKNLSKKILSDKI